ncbi:pentatricopeptide repeat-containing protein At4g35850, mitochondrial [Pistacia vera]|uniref:pentatricopeptide repeat-containing protein At4g35850, mitochondrial n=1 Tax=Pistacia vera TaxID=55513 RepID=UPI001263150A|nr:pentatricopeptide repeat-containing protein At4g35850, mitochondrial [Pistacia vera]
MKLLQSIYSHHRSLGRALGRRFLCASTEAYARRNYANNLSEYNTVVLSVAAQRKHYLLRDVYYDMLLDGVQPTRDVFHSLIAGTMKGSRLQDALYFKDQMKAGGSLPDVTLYNFLISTCGKCKNCDQAIRIFEEMKSDEVKPNGPTYVCLLNACAAAGRIDRVYAIVRDMTAAGAGLNKFCYAGLIAAHINKTPRTVDTAAKIIEFVEASKGWTSVEESSTNAENVMMGVSEEELYNLPTADYAVKRGFLNRQLTVYHVAFHACVELRNVEAMETLLEMLKKEGNVPDVFIVMQTIRCYMYSGDIDRGHKTFEDYMNSGKPRVMELYVTLIEGAMVGYTPRGMQLAEKTLLSLNDKGFYLTHKQGSDLLIAASGEKTGGYTTANLIWDMMQARKIPLSFAAVEAYYYGLKGRQIPEDDPRLLLVFHTYDNLRPNFGRQTQTRTQ